MKWYKVKDLWYEVKWGFQRMFRGYDDTAFWGLDAYLTKICIPVLKFYKNSKYHGYPYLGKIWDKKSDEKQRAEWNRILDTMIAAFELMDEDSWLLEYKNDQERTKNLQIIEEGLRLFGKYYRALWD